MTTEEAENYTLGFLRANVGALLLAVPVCAFYIVLYSAAYGWEAVAVDMQELFLHPVLFLLLFAGGIVVHEGIHAVSWSWLGGISLENIHFGFQWSTITPYVHCPVPVSVRSYRWGTALPGLVLGIMPYLLALLFQNGWLLGFGLLFTLAAGGDFLILWLLRKAESGAFVQDHPDLIGCRITDKPGLGNGTLP